MAGIKDTVSKGFTAINLKTNNFVAANKINTYITTLETEIKEIRSKIGILVYENWKNEGDFDKEALDGLCSQIKAKEEEIERQKGQIEELEKQEQQILGKKEEPAGNSDMTGKIFCSNCGSVNSDKYKFCVKCGKPL